MFTQFNALDTLTIVAMKPSLLILNTYNIVNPKTSKNISGGFKDITYARQVFNLVRLIWKDKAKPNETRED